MAWERKGGSSSPDASVKASEIITMQQLWSQVQMLTGVVEWLTSAGCQAQLVQCWCGAVLFQGNSARGNSARGSQVQRMGRALQQIESKAAGSSWIEMLARRQLLRFGIVVTRLAEGS